MSDLVVLAEDPFEVDPGHVEDSSVEMVVMRGASSTIAGERIAECWGQNHPIKLARKNAIRAWPNLLHITFRLAETATLTPRY
jgi:hypothetical protein